MFKKIYQFLTPWHKRARLLAELVDQLTGEKYELTKKLDERVELGRNILTIGELIEQTGKRILQIENALKVHGLEESTQEALVTELEARQKSMELLLNNFKPNDYVRKS